MWGILWIKFWSPYLDFVAALFTLHCTCHAHLPQEFWKENSEENRKECREEKE